MNVVNKLVERYKKWGRLIIAFDFDDTVYPYSVPVEELRPIHELLRRAKAQGHMLVLFTCRHDQSVPSQYCYHNGFMYDKFNESVDIGQYGKIYYNIFLEDKAGLWETAQILDETLNEIEKLQKEA